MGRFLSSDKLFFGGVIVASLVIVLVAVAVLSGGGKPVSSQDLVKEDSHVLGERNAKVQIVEFADYQCPACRLAQSIVKQVIASYSDKAVFVYRHFPLIGTHQYSLEAAQASEAAGEQGKFWQYHDLLFENQEHLDHDSLISYAKRLNLDIKKFEEALNSGKYKDKVMADLTAGEQAGVDSTPTFFINGKKYVGVQSFDQFKSIIENELKAAK